VAHAGSPCEIASQCAQGFYCDSTTKTCIVRAQLGASCGPAQSCIDGLVCASGVCAAGLSMPGEACTFQGAGCDEYAGLACNAVSGTCQTLQLADPGQACGIVQDQLQACKFGVCVRGQCQGTALPGQACDLVAGPSCIVSAQCIVAADGGTHGVCLPSGVTSCN
jgi:hypothetical protein